ncbi:penicillin-binding protein [Desertihabitans aurantiacus]|uniref:penicillin-binding protein n=1 Tax=Desertihabitans aurantiacus TaxID=2282477 RepID=UPI000DF776AF|nr:penicillin-binding protein [Desertihabitans aurantiacus]
MSTKRLGNLAYSTIMFVVVSVLMGLLAAGLVVPFAAVAGTGSRATADSLELLPADLETPPQPERSQVLMADGSVLADFFEENRVYVPLEDIAPVMQQAQIAIEDHRFYEHGAIDLVGTLRAFAQNTAGGSTQGGSSITQQYVKMVQIEKAKAAGDEAGILAAQEQSYSRKIQEMRYAIAMEKRFSKDEILERYLNIAYYGDGAYGVNQAAWHYFGKTAKNLELAEAAMLAGLVQNPTATDPVRFPERAIERRDVVINRMVQLGLVTPEAAKEAAATEWDPGRVKSFTNGCVGTEFPFLCDYVRQTLLTNEALGSTVAERESQLKRGGLRIETQIDRKTQQAAEKAISELIAPTDPVISTMTMVQPGTGLIMAMAQSRPEMGTDKGQTYYNYAVPASLGGAEGFQAGSTFKTFVAAAALEKGIPMTKRYNAPQQKDFSDTRFQACEGTVKVPKGYKPRNSTRSGSNMSMATATAWSVNTYFLQLGRDTGMCNVTEMLDKTGVALSSGDPWAEQSTIFSLPLGSVDITPLSMAEGYATFAADGVHCEPVIVERVTSGTGEEIPIPGAGCERVVEADVARGVNSLLQGVMDATGRPADIGKGYATAGKTGTTDNNQAVWFCGYTPEVAGCASIAIDKTNPYWKGKRKSLKGRTLPVSDTYLAGSGGGDAGQFIWKPAMTEALKGKPKTKFPKPSNNVREGKTADVPSVVGLSAEEAEEKLNAAGFNVVRANTYSSAPRGAYLGPSDKSRAKQGSTIYLYFSAGPRPQPRDDDDDDKKKSKKSSDNKKDSKKKDSKKDDEDDDE